ncbi:hypothetical protein BJX68DRAFT_255837 [Aspergillus pseudodeflectus]|uniref:Uncharacterized protein n=1 Tax=Aspergillus pseudodeflectus TaxID=176178 RepID=A0ABR4KA83_9EURO
MLARRALGLLLQAVVAQAKLPLATNKPEAELKNSKEVTFDPLGVAAILHNPRAHRSAARLYTQPYGSALTWPHFMMFGATLIPLQVLVAHLDRGSNNIHPAVASLCLGGTTQLPIVSDTRLRELSLDVSNSWLRDAIGFKASLHALNDVMIVNIPPAHPEGLVGRVENRNAHRLILGILSLLTGLMFTGVVVAAILVLDLWALALFFFYGLHWLAGVGISIVAPLYRSRDRVMPDRSPRSAIIERPMGGLVVLRGTQETFEIWARSNWDFQRSLLNNCLHWSWISTGAIAAICSVACMVNMRGYIQLAFLGLLLCSSLAEIVASRFYSQLDTEVFNASTCLLLESTTRIQAIVRATVEIDAAYRLHGINWIELGLLPPLGTFQGMDRVEAGEETVPAQGPVHHKSVEGAFQQFTEGVESSHQTLANRILHDVQTSLEVWWEREKRRH